jgi:hypothetical protein
MPNVHGASKRFIAANLIAIGGEKVRDPLHLRPTARTTMLFAIAALVIDKDSAPAPGDGEGGSSAALARALVSFEARFEAERPDSIVLADASDAALAAALVAAKLLIEIHATPAATGAAGANAGLIAQLAGAYTPSA